MRILKNLLFLTLAVLISSCVSSKKFPTSSVVPAANITAKKRVDNQKNFSLEITSQNLASPDRLNPPGSNYSVWIVSKEHGTKNVGQLIVENGKENKFKTVTPFDFDEIFITVENQGDLQYPRGVEIARTRL